MSKTFFDMMGAVLDEYHEAKLKAMPGVDMAHYNETLKRELAMNVQQWFYRYIDAIAGNVTEIKHGLELQSNARPHDIPRPPKNRNSLV